MSQKLLVNGFKWVENASQFNEVSYIEGLHILLKKKNN